MRLAAAAFATILRRLSSSIPEASAAASSCSSAVGSRASFDAPASSSAEGSGSFPGANRRPAGAASPSVSASLARSFGSSWESSKAHARGARRDVQLAVAGQPRRPRVAGDLLAHRLRPGRTIAVIPSAGPKRDELPLDVAADPLRLHDATRARPGSTSTSWFGSNGSADAPVAVTSVWPAAAQPLGEGAAPALVELREDVVEQEERRRGPRSSAAPPRRAGARARRAAARPASRSGAGRAPPAAIPTSSRCGPSPVVPRSRSRVEPGLERLARRRLGVVAELGAGQAELAGALGEGGHERGDRLARAPRRAPPRAPRPARVHGATASRDGELRRSTRRSAAFRCASAAPYSAGSAGPRREKPAEHAVEVGAARGRPAFDDGEPVGGEDERRDLARAAARPTRSGAPFSVARFALAGRERHLDLDRRAGRDRRASSTRGLGSPKRTSCASLRVRGEKPCVPTWSASSRFVLPAPFGPTASTSPGSRSSSSEA